MEDAYCETLSARFPSHRPESNKYEWNPTKVFINKTDLGEFFGKLALETVEFIIDNLDIRSLLRLRSTSKAWKPVIDSLPAFRAIVNCVPDIVPIIYSTGLGEHILAKDVYAALCQAKCRLCDQGGRYLYLFTCERLCNGCLTTVERYRPLRPMQATAQFSLAIHQLKDVPRLRVPLYSDSARRFRLSHWYNRKNTSGWILLDREDVRRQALAVHGTQGIIDDKRTKKLEEIYRMRDRKHNIWISRFTPALVEASLSAAVTFPWWDRESGHVGIPDEM